MIKVDQMYMHNPPESIGDCHAACLATILEVHLSDVPRIKGIEDADIKIWWDKLGDWLNWKGLYLFNYDVKAGVNTHHVTPSDSTVWIAGGKSTRGSLHCVVMLGDDIFHDPHPSRSGLLSIEFAGHLVIVNPSKYQRIKF